MSPLLPTVARDASFVSILTIEDKYRLKIAPLAEFESHTVDTIAEAEDRFFASAPEMVFSPSQMIGSNDPTVVMSALSIFISRASNFIAQNTRRSVGNKVFMHHSMLQSFMVFANEWTRPGIVENPVESGRWTHYADFRSASIYTSLECPEDEIYVAYVGLGDVVDGPGAVMTNGSELLCIPNTSEHSAIPPEAYLYRIKVDGPIA